MGFALAARAKLNLYLGVRALRDDGYHEIETVLHSIELADTVAFEAAQGLSVSCEPAIDVDASGNLAFLAARELAEDAGIEPAARICIAKHIPRAAGLGGGSADAAGALVGAARLWGLGWPRARLVTIAVSVGADVPFMLTGGAAIGRGRGDELEPVPPWPGLAAALALPKRPLATARVYAAARPGQGGPPVEGAAAALAARNLEALGDLMHNALTEPAVELAPEIGDALGAAERAGLPALMSGSGPTVFALSDDAERLNALVGMWRAEGFETATSRLSAVGVSDVAAPLEGCAAIETVPEPGR